MDIHGDGVGLRRAGGAAALGHVPCEQAGEPPDDLRVLVLNIVLLTDVGRQVEQLHGRQLVGVVPSGMRTAPAARARAQRQLPRPCRIANDPLIE